MTFFSKQRWNSYLYLINSKERDNRKLKLLMHISLNTVLIEDIHDDKAGSEHVFSILFTFVGFKNCFRLNAPKKSIIVKAKTPEEKEEWMRLIQSSIDNQLEKSKSFHGSSSMNM
jgi:hypothetical protein